MTNLHHVQLQHRIECCFSANTTCRPKTRWLLTWRRTRLDRCGVRRQVCWVSLLCETTPSSRCRRRCPAPRSSSSRRRPASAWCCCCWTPGRRPADCRTTAGVGTCSARNPAQPHATDVVISNVTLLAHACLATARYVMVVVVGTSSVPWSHLEN